MIPALPATYAARLAVPFSPATEAMFTIAPPPLASMAGIWNFIPRKVPRTLVAMPRSNSSGSMSASGAGMGPAVALLNAASSRPNTDTAWSTTWRIEPGSVTSAPTASARPPRASMPLGDGLQRGGVAGGEDHRGPGGGERLGGGRADALARPGHQRDPPAHRLPLGMLVHDVPPRNDSISKHMISND